MQLSLFTKMTLNTVLYMCFVLFFCWEQFVTKQLDILPPPFSLISLWEREGKVELLPDPKPEVHALRFLQGLPVGSLCGFFILLVCAVLAH